MHPLMRRMLELVAASPLTEQEITRRAGVNRELFRMIRYGKIQAPRIDTMQSVLQAIGADLVVAPSRETMLCALQALMAGQMTPSSEEVEEVK